MTNFSTRVTTLVVLPDNEPLTSNSAITITITNNEYEKEIVIVEQDGNCISIDVDSWTALREAIDRLVNGCR
jgi:hypothetical protein